MKNLSYILFKGFAKKGEYTTIEEAKNAIDNNDKGIYNVCTVTSIDGKFSVLERESIIIN